MNKTFVAPRPLSACVLAIGVLFGIAHADEYSDAVALTRNGSYSEAMSKVDKALAKTPKDPKMRLLKALIQDRSGKTNEAILTLLRLVEDNPELPEPYNNLAVFYASQNQYDKARAALEAAVKNDPAYSTAHENLGDVYAELARQAYKKAQKGGGGDQNLDRKVDLIREIFSPGTTKSAKATAAAAAQTAAAPTISAAPVAPPVAAPAASSATPAHAPAAQSAAAAPPEKAEKVEKASTANATAAAVAAPAKSNSADADVDSKRVEEAVSAWAKAWSAKDMANYLGAYGKDFVPAGNLSREAWESERTARITSRAYIKVSITNLQVSVEGNKATARFRQGYKATGLVTSDLKTLELVKNGDRWEITKEATGG